jgi:hypothetical protein
MAWFPPNLDFREMESFALWMPNLVSTPGPPPAQG